MDLYVARHFNDTADGGRKKTTFRAVKACAFDEEDIYGAEGDARFGEVSIGGTLVPTPARPEKILRQIYGDAWMTPTGSGGHGVNVSGYCEDEW